MSKQTNQSSSSTKTKLDILKDDYDTKNGQLTIQQKRLNALLSDVSGGDISEIGILSDVVAKLKQEVKAMKTELQLQGVFSKGADDQEADRQTIISSASVRKKDAEALKLP
jgi:hypothetical protein